ncbi:Transcriptional regulatory protein, C terminal [Nonomuraea solani]|uniref:Transcriptional regulatory protein, C terminal n=1 Tax=Nonomuraea solani TaxID=1144553 RepID=A0A1H6E722_9ACTN|nr:BTAD domain-containing putative transcriptional regulator [Nonomuraea solani]SEG93457.1 Transcriptional regulatory protein, C terminal [Nonomuraea solani]
MLTFRVLGPLAAHLDGEPVALGRPRQRSVLARLLAAGGQVVPVDRLIDDLYAGEVPPKALAAVQSYVSNLRRALEPGRSPRAQAGVLVTQPPGYALRLEAGAVDAWRFEALAGDPDAGHERLAEALALWHGPAYQEFAGAHWADAEASRLEELRLSTVERHAGAVIRIGGAARAVPELERLAAEHPLREGAWALLARALYRCGRQGEALGALRRARAHLAEELGVDPGPELRRLEADILAQAAHLSEAAPPPTPVPRPTAAGQPYVGRRAELDAVTGLDGGAVLVSGEPGAGKTAFMEQVRGTLEPQGWAVGWGRCPEYEGAPPGWAWAELLRQLAARFPPGEPEALAPLLSDTPVRGDVPGARFRLRRAVGAFVTSIGRPLLLVLDDLHRADAETLAILTHVIGEAAGLPVLVVVSYRHTEPNDHLADALAAIAAREPLRVELNGLAAPEVGELISVTCGRPAAPETVAEVAERTGGNPFFVRETARLLDSEGVVALPAGVRDVLRRRVARLPAQAQTILRHGAVIGRESDVDVLTVVSGADEEAVLSAIEAGLVTGLLVEPEAGRLRFAHALIRDTLYDDLSRIRRARLHLRVARAIEEHDPGDVAALAHHYTASAADPVKAVRYTRLAAEQAERRFAHHEAAALWRQALDTSTGGVRERLDLTLSLVSALANTGRLGTARAHRESAVRDVLPMDDPHLLAQVIVSFDVPTFWSNREYGTLDSRLVQAIEEALDRLPAGDGRTRCRLLTALGYELEGEPDERGYLASQEAVAMARRLGDRHLLVLALNGRLHQSFRYGGSPERERIGAELLTLSGSDVTVEALGHLVLMQAAINRADLAESDRHAARAAHLARLYDLPLTLAVTGFYDGLRAALAGDHAGAETHYRAAAELAGRLGMWQHEAGIHLLSRYGLHLMRGDLSPLVPEVEPFTSMGTWQEQARELYALALCHAGRAEEARALVPAEPRPIRRDYFWHVLTVVRGLLGVAIGDRGRAEAAYEALLPFSAEPVGSTGYLAIWPTAQVLGELAAYLGRPAEPHFREALAVGERAGVRLWIDAARDRMSD